MKRILASILSICLLFSFTACTKVNEDLIEEETQNETEEKEMTEEEKIEENLKNQPNDVVEDEEVEEEIKEEKKTSKWDAYEVGDIITYGKVGQKRDGTTTPIEWIILDKKEDRMLILSKKGLERVEKTYESDVLATAFSYEEAKAIIYKNDLEWQEYEKYSDIIKQHPCTATLQAFMNLKKSTPFEVTRYQWQIDKLDTTEVYWYLSEDKIADKDCDGYAYSGGNEVYCRPAMWVSLYWFKKRKGYEEYC